MQWAPIPRYLIAACSKSETSSGNYLWSLIQMGDKRCLAVKNIDHRQNSKASLKI